VRGLVQRVTAATVRVRDESIARIGAGLFVLVGVRTDDGTEDADWLADKIAGLRIFENEAGRFDLSVEDVGGDVLVVSQFTLYADTTRGRHPSFEGAAVPDHARPLYERVAERLAGRGLRVERGCFGAHMHVELDNDGPVTILLESEGRRTSRGGSWGGAG